jgi:hypothetical protein
VDTVGFFVERQGGRNAVSERERYRRRGGRERGGAGLGGGGGKERRSLPYLRESAYPQFMTSFRDPLLLNPLNLITDSAEITKSIRINNTIGVGSNNIYNIYQFYETISSNNQYHFYN